MHNATKRPAHMAWHETLELHELTAASSNYLMGFKMVVDDVKDAQLKALYLEAITTLENNLKELTTHYAKAPVAAVRSTGDGDLTGFYAGKLLLFAKTAVRNYAIAITETATPSVRETLVKQLNAAIVFHAKVFNFMFERGLYPAYSLPELLSNDLMLAKKALSIQA